MLVEYKYTSTYLYGIVESEGTNRCARNDWNLDIWLCIFDTFNNHRSKLAHSRVRLSFTILCVVKPRRHTEDLKFNARDIPQNCHKKPFNLLGGSRNNFEENQSDRRQLLISASGSIAKSGPRHPGERWNPLIWTRWWTTQLWRSPPSFPVPTFPRADFTPRDQVN